MTRKLKPVSPGEMLVEEFLKPLGMSNYRLAKEIGVPRASARSSRKARHHCRHRPAAVPLFEPVRWLVAAPAGGLRYGGREGWPREDAREDQTMEGGRGADGGCALTFGFRTGVP